MGFVRKHPLLFAVIALIFVTIPGAIDAWWSLLEKLNGVAMPSLELGFLYWIFPILGLVLFVIIVRQLGKIQPTITFKNHPTMWLEQVLEDDKANISSRVYVRDYVWELKGLKEPDAFIELIFTLINAAVFPINIMGTTGRFLIEEHECAQEAEFMGTKRIPHGDKGGIRIKQRLTRDMADLIIGSRDLIPTSKMEVAKKGKVNISLKACQLLISSEIAGGDSKPIPLTIGGDYEVNIS